MNLHLDGRVALITGAAGGLGLAISLAFAREGCAVAMLDCDRDALGRAAAAVRSHTRVVEIIGNVEEPAASVSAVKQVLEQLGRLDILVCCAGITRDAMSWKITDSDWSAVLNVNLTGCFTFARAVTPVFRAANAGTIINITSINGLRGKPGQANYAASKAGVIGLTKTLARELGHFGITVNAVAPGMVTTPMTQQLGAQVTDAALQESALGRLTSPEDIADAVLFLSSQRARRITGEVLRVDAGQYI